MKRVNSKVAPAAPTKNILKVILVGDPGVGKTAIMNQYVNHRFINNYLVTVGVDFMCQDIEIEGRRVTLQIWDTAGQERFQALSGKFYRGADCCILTFDVTNPASFKSIESWRDELLIQACPPVPETFPFVLLGNKMDLTSQRAVPGTKADSWAAQYGIPYFETSAKYARNVDTAFSTAAKAALMRASVLGPVEEEFNIVNLPFPEPPSRAGSCCSS